MLLGRIRRAGAAMLLIGAGAATGCATQKAAAPAQFVQVMRVKPPSGAPGYDAVFYPSGEIDYFPDREHPRRLIAHKGVHGTIEIACLSNDCSDMVVRTTGVAGKANSVDEYTFLGRQIALIRDSYTGNVAGYLAVDSKGRSRTCETLEEADTFAHGQDLGPRLAQIGEQIGKDVLAVAVIAAVVVGVVAVAAAEGSAGTYAGSTGTGYSANAIAPPSMVAPPAMVAQPAPPPAPEFITQAPAIAPLEPAPPLVVPPAPPPLMLAPPPPVPPPYAAPTLPAYAAPEGFNAR
jgi:hypothetical protein